MGRKHDIMVTKTTTKMSPFFLREGIGCKETHWTIGGNSIVGLLENLCLKVSFFEEGHSQSHKKVTSPAFVRIIFSADIPPKWSHKHRKTPEQAHLLNSNKTFISRFHDLRSVLKGSSTRKCFVAFSMYLLLVSI